MNDFILIMSLEGEVANEKKGSDDNKKDKNVINGNPNRIKSRNIHK